MNPEMLPLYVKTPEKQPEEQHEDSHIIKIAKLVMLLTSPNVSNEDKLGCLKLDVKNGLITQDEAMELLINIDDLKDFV